MDQEGIRQRMRERIDQVGISQKSLADGAGVPYRTVQNWFTGTTEKIPVEFLAQYVTLVPVDPRWLLTGEGSPSPSGEGVGERLHSLLDRLMRSTLSAAEKRNLLREFERLLKEVEEAQE